MKKTLAFLLTAILIFSALPVSAAKLRTNILPGGSFADEVYAEGVEKNIYASGESFNGGTWTATFTANEADANESGYCTISKLSDGTGMVEIRRGGKGVGTLRSKAMTLKAGTQYTFGYTLRCSSQSGANYKVLVNTYTEGEEGLVVDNTYEVVAEDISNELTSKSAAFTLDGEAGTDVTADIVISVESNRRALQIRAISLWDGTFIDAPEEEVKEEGNILPGGAFESEVFTEENPTYNIYASGDTFNGGTWKCVFDANRPEGAVESNLGSFTMSKNQTTGEVIAAIRRGNGNDPYKNKNGYITSMPFPAEFGATYRLSFDGRCTSKNATMNVTPTIVAYKGENFSDSLYQHGLETWTFSNGEQAKFCHVEQIFTLPAGRKDATHIGLMLSIGSSLRTFELKNISLTKVTKPFLAYRPDTTLLSENYESRIWCNSDSYPSLRAHTIFTQDLAVPANAAPVAFEAGKELILFPTGFEKAAEGEGEQKVILAQYNGAGALVAIDFMETETALENEREYLRRIKSKNITLSEDAKTFRVFYRGNDNLLLPKRDIEKGKITAPVVSE